jgi:hypothetical protein
VPLNGGRSVLILDVFLRSVITAMLALGITGAASYVMIVQHRIESPLINWAGIIVGVYFGSVVATRGEDRRRHIDATSGTGERAGTG